MIWDRAIDDMLFRPRGKKVWGASWFHDGSAPGPAKTGYGNVRDCLQVALRHDLADGPALKQAVTLLRRGAALGTAGRGLVAAARC